MDLTFFSSAHGTFWRLEHILGYKSSLSKLKKKKKLKSFQAFFWSKCSKIRHQLQEKNIKNTNIWWLNNTLLNNQQITEEIKKEIKIYIETNDNENTTTENIWDSVKAVLSGKFIPIQAYLKKQEQHQINNLISFQFSRSVMSDSLQPHELQHARPPCPSPTPRVYPNSCPLSQGCHPTISSSVAPFSSCPQSFPASGSFHMSQLFASGGQSSEINNLTYTKSNWKKKKNNNNKNTKNPTVSRRKEIIKIRAEINEKETKETIPKINKLKVGSLRR